MIEHYYKISVLNLGIDPIKFWEYTPKEINLISDRREIEWKEKHEFEAWKISWLISPHCKNAIEPNKIFNYEKIKEKIDVTETDEAEAFERQFMSREELQKKQAEIIVSRLKEINANKAREAQEAKDNGNN